MKGSLLTKEINYKNNESSQNGTALIIKGRFVEKGKDQERCRSKSKTRRSLKDIEYYHCGKKGHLKKNCGSFKKENDKGKDKRKKKAEGESSVKIKEVNALSGDNGSKEGDIFLTSSVEPSNLVITNEISVNTDSRASFHVTPHRQWFTSYDAKRTGRV